MVEFFDGVAPLAIDQAWFQSQLRRAALAGTSRTCNSSSFKRFVGCCAGATRCPWGAWSAGGVEHGLGVAVPTLFADSARQ